MLVGFLKERGKGILFGWWGGRVGRRRRNARLLAPFCVIWINWWERNKRSFQDVEESVHKLKCFLLALLYCWLHGAGTPLLDSLVEFFVSQVL